jgi:hypothetical protein
MQYQYGWVSRLPSVRKAEKALECCAELSKQMRIAALHNGKVSPRDILETLAKYGQEK